MILDYTEILTYTIGNNSVKDYLIALSVFVLALIAFKVFKHIIINKLKKKSTRTKSKLDDKLIKIINKVAWPVFLVLSLYLALNFIQIPNIVETIIHYAMLLIVTFFVVMGINYFIDYTIRKIILKRKKEEKETDTSIINLLKKILKGILWGIAVIFIISNLGYDVTTLVAGLGIAGIAVAFALQNVLSDLFASFSIYFDKPFKVGDFIIVGDDLGVVKKIGIRSTRLRSLWGHEIVISNKELTTTRINNYKKMRRRRVHFNFGVVYRTPTKKLKKILKIIKGIFDKIELADLDRVHFKEFAESSLKFEVAYYVNTGDYNKYMDIQQEINLAIKEKFEKEGIEFAYPTQTVFVNK